MTKIGVMICGHGSRSQAAVDEFSVLAEKLPALLPDDWDVEYGYLEFANPVIRDGLDRLRQNGCDRILAVPGMLFAAMHAKNDIPTVLNSYAAKHGIEISYGRELGVDPKMIAAAGARIQDAVARANADLGEVALHDTCLVVIGRGASDPDANGNVSKIARMLQEGMGFGWLEVGYSGVTFPLVEPCLNHAAKLGYKRIIVFPYFLFTGILIDRIYGFTDQVAARHPDIQFVKAGYLNDHPKVLETFAERVKEQLSDAPPPNCGICGYRSQVLGLEDGAVRRIDPADRAGHPAFGDVPPAVCVLCKYRVEVLGFEAEVGAVQESHHHHVEGQGASAPGSNVADCALCDTFCTGECRLQVGHHHHHDHDHDHGHHHDHDHAHDHAHPEYPHADHPLGPESARKHRH
ncbi:Sirohydrochlorin cobaltochelatase [Thalassovita gelatinovora]|uniref:Sirohydrochlorin cobaltochelatase n=1 Tax=Thalassovita gelatinovora TaxID=53501 RepID=A0A0N7LVG5_THAGE|nr:sirohydrochlorin chelatase [Thalassovita gelatinovora]QIZ81433.1 sirohydrochlorin chelatase [Thalassovita gelatinovora]CUH66234.1 Sirohydrochlorin cobaltochelatase [Thalassovita gelatinovora]SEQ22172.1 sirohydrochlorin cobaltochelatase [Thalassovita gelatinovora]